MALIDSNRLTFFLGAAHQAKSAWEVANGQLLAADRHDPCAWAQAQYKADQAFSCYNSATRDVTTVVQLLIERAELAQGFSDPLQVTSDKERNPRHASL
jgi:hypothetical protein